jgi:drug/metabolite transporter (DMT)-like permease
MGNATDSRNARKFFGAAIILTVVAIAGFVVWYDDAERASSEGGANLVVASHAFLIGIVALFTASVAWFTALRSLGPKRISRLCDLRPWD